MTKTRQLAAIMFTDIVGYTSMMGSDMDKALELVRISKSIQQPLVEKYNGKWLKEMGDGVMVMFGTAIDAVHCAIDIQKNALKNLDAKLRIGIHLGDITIENQDIYGDGVNVASRLESICIPGGIYVSDSIRKAIRGENTQMISLGSRKLKNVNDKVSVFAIKDTGLRSPSINQRISGNKKIYYWAGVVVAIIALSVVLYFTLRDTPRIDRSIAVLPFTDMSPEGDQEYLGDGIAEEILNALAKINGLRVIGRTSSFSYKGRNVDLREIGKELEVATILEGSIRKSENKIRVTAQLINSEDGSHLWSETYDRELSDIFEVQDEISKKIADKFKLTLYLSEESEPPTENIEAYELYLKGKQQADRGLPGKMQAIEYFKKAVEIDPDFVLALADLSNMYWVAGLYGLGDQVELNEKSRESALAAIEVGPDDYHGYDILSYINFSIDWDWENALKNSQKAKDLGMISGEYPYIHAGLYGGGEEPINIVKNALDNDPLSVFLLLDLSRMYLYAGQYEHVIQNAERVIELKPENTSIKRHLGFAYFFLDNYEESKRYFDELLTIDSTYVPYGNIAALHKLNRTDEAYILYNAVSDKLNPIKKAFCFMSLNEPDSAFKYLEFAFQEKDRFMAFIKSEPHFQLIAEDPRYQDLIARMGLDKYQLSEN